MALQVLPPSQWFISAAQLDAATSGSSAAAGAAGAAQVTRAAASGGSALADELPDAQATQLDGEAPDSGEAPAGPDDELACEADHGFLPNQAQLPVGGAPLQPNVAAEPDAAEQAIQKKAKEREKKAAKRRSLLAERPPGVDLVGATRAQLEAQYGNGGGAPWDRAGTPQDALAIIAAL